MVDQKKNEKEKEKKKYKKLPTLSKSLTRFIIMIVQPSPGGGGRGGGGRGGGGQVQGLFHTDAHFMYQQLKMINTLTVGLILVRWLASSNGTVPCPGQ